MKFGLLTKPTVEIVHEIRAIRKLDFDYAEIGIEWPEGSPEVLHEKRTVIVKELEKFELPPLGHTAWWMDFTSPYEFIRVSWIEEAKQAVLAAKSLGIKLLNFHTSSRYGKAFYNRWAPQIRNNYVRSMREIISFAHKNGVTIMLENAAESGEIAMFSEFKQVVDKLPGAKVHLDIPHAYINGGMSSVKKFIEHFGNRIVHLHIHDNHGVHDEHLPLGAGTVDFEKVVRWLKKINYDRTVTFEVFTSKRDALQSRETFRRLWNKL